MSKILLITDTHVGVRNGSDAFLSNQRKFLREVFFPLIRKENVQGIFHLGDLVDRRRGIDYKVANFLREEFLDPISSLNIPTDIICGNHDAPHKNNLAHNALIELVGNKYPCIETYSVPGVVKGYGPKFLLVPWICDENRNQCLAAIDQLQADYVLGHFELKGFKMYQNTPVAEHGMDPDILSRFDHVYSGHFHSKSTQGNITYLGSPYEMTWSDHGDPKGVHILDTETLELTFYRNPFTMFLTVNYDDAIMTQPMLVDGKIVKVIVKDRDTKFDDYLKALENAGAVEVQVVEQPLVVSRDDTAPDEENGDVLSVLKKSVQELGEGVDHVALYGLLSEIHTEATQGV